MCNPNYNPFKLVSYYLFNLISHCSDLALSSVMLNGTRHILAGVSFPVPGALVKRYLESIAIQLEVLRSCSPTSHFLPRTLDSYKIVLIKLQSRQNSTSYDFGSYS